jgi:polyisoprenoid-binding protein YceI
MKSKNTLRRTSLTLLTLICLPLASHADNWKGSCEVKFSGESTLHDFAGTVSAEPYTVSITGLDDPMTATASCKVVVKAARMDTDNEKRDAAMHKSMDAETYPDIVVDVSGMKAAVTEPVSGEGDMPRPTVLPFKMKLKGKTHEVEGRVSDWKFDGKTVDCVVSFPVSLEKSGIKPPSVLGVVKVKDEIKVSAHIVLKRN